MALTKKTYSEQGILNQCFDPITGGLKIAGQINGNLIVTGNLTVNGNFTFGDATTDVLTVTGVIRNADGTAAAPSYSFTSDPGTGFRWLQSGVLQYVGNGTAGINFWTGIVSVDMIAALSSTAMSFRGSGANGATAIGNKVGNLNALTTAGAKIISFYNDNFTTEKAAIGLGGEVMAGAGTAALPSLSFLGDIDTGFYNVAGNVIGIVLNGAGYNKIDTTGIYSNKFRDYSTTTVTLQGNVADGATAVGTVLDNGTSLVTAGAKITSFRNATVEKAYIDKDGLAYFAGGLSTPGNVGIGTASPTALLNLKGTLSSALTGTVAVTQTSADVVGTGTAFTTELAVGDSIKIGTEIFTVSVITDATHLTLDSAYAGATASGLTAYRDSTLFAIDNGDAVNKLTVTRSGSVLAGAGTVALPSLSFLGDIDTGIYSGGANIIGFAANGNYVGAINDSWMRAVAFTSYSVYSVDMVGQIPNGATAIGAKIGNANSLTTAGAKIASFYSDNKTTEKAYIDLNGKFSGAGVQVSVTAQTAATLTLSTVHEVIVCDSTANAIALTLPDASTALGKRYIVFFAVRGGTNNTTMTTAAGDTFDGTNNTATFDLAEDWIEIIGISANRWLILNNNSVALSEV